jgi:hypothetical protein
MKTSFLHNFRLDYLQYFILTSSTGIMLQHLDLHNLENRQYKFSPPLRQTRMVNDRQGMHDALSVINHSCKTQQRQE